MILASGAFDGLHSGHVAYLEAAKCLCQDNEVLVCAVAPDRYITEAKGRTPLWSQLDRLQTVNAVGVVDAAVAQIEPSVADLIRQYHPRLFVKGIDWEARLPEDVLLACDETGTAIAYVETPGTHVSETTVTDEQALTQFETLVLSQHPATTPWTPVTDYSFEARRVVEEPHARLIKDVFQPLKVLDVGCGPGHLVRLLRWLEVLAQGCDKRQQPPGLYYDIVKGGARVTPVVDLVICREVLEHLTIREVRQAVQNLCLLSSRFVYGTTRFNPAPLHLLDVATHDDLDPTHITLMTKSFLRMLFALDGFRWRGDLATRMDWRGYGRTFVFERT